MRGCVCAVVCVLLVLVAACLAWADSPVQLKAGDTITILLDEPGDIAALEVRAIPRVAAVDVGTVSVEAPVYETVYEQVCVGGVCTLQPVRRLVSASRTVTRTAATTAARAMVGSVLTLGGVTCGCGCPGCTCSAAAVAVAGGDSDRAVTVTRSVTRERRGWFRGLFGRRLGWRWR